MVGSGGSLLGETPRKTFTACANGILAGCVEGCVKNKRIHEPRPPPQDQEKRRFVFSTFSLSPFPREIT